jgi:CBS domain containing-hemolysin-like protein
MTHVAAILAVAAGDVTRLPAAVLPAEHWESGEIILLRLLAILALVLLNGFFVASELAVVKIRASQLDTLIEQGDARAMLAKHITSHLEAYISATQLGITLASLGLGWLGEPFLAHIIEPAFRLAGIESATLVTTVSFVIAFSLITFLHIVLGELVPKSLAIRKPVQLALWLSPPLGLFYTLFRPVIRFLNLSANFLLRHLLRVEPPEESERALSNEELRVILTESREAKEVSPLGERLAVNALDLQHRVVRDIMTPRSEVIFLDLEESFSGELTKAIDSRHTRFPLCTGALDESVGLVHIKDLLGLVQSGRQELKTIQRPIHHVSEMMPLEKLLNYFLAKHAHLAIAVDEYGGAVGIVTLDNVLEELVGSIHDEFDTKEEEITKISDGEFDAEGTLALHDLAEETGLKFEETEVSTIGGYITQLLGHLPARGESIRIGDYTATVAETDGRRILKVHFKKPESGESTLPENEA